MNKKTTIIIILLAALSIMLIVGCGGRNERGALYAGGAIAQKASLTSDGGRAAGAAYGVEMEAAMADMAYDMAAPMPAAASTMSRQMMSDEGNWLREGADASAAEELNAVERKLIQRAYISIRVENLDAADASVTGMLHKYDAYAASTEVDENFRSYSLRVPAPRYGAFLAEMNGMGRLLHRSENTEDVTLRYYDLEGRLETKKELLKTFQSYLGTAKTIEEILAVEARISELQYDIEGTGMQLRNLANRVDYATIDMTLFGPVAITPNQSVTFGERLRQMFGNFGVFLSAVAVVMVGLVIYGIPVLLLAVLLFWLLLGRIGLLKKLWRLVRGKRQ
jgi:hypothetical protein